MNDETKADVEVAVHAKACVVCGVDCTGRPRVKDPKGRYYCRACYDARAASSPALANGRAGAVTATDPMDAPIEFAAIDPAEVPVGRGNVTWPTMGAAQKPARSGPSIRPGEAIVKLLTGSPLLKSFGSLLVMLVIIAACAVNVVDNAGLRRLLGEAPTWASFYVTAGLIVLLGATIVRFLAPWWYRARLGWSGGRSIDFVDASLVYTASLVPCAIWSGAIVASVILGASNVLQVVAPTSEFLKHTLPVITMALAATGVAVTFLTARQGYGASFGRALFWFVILPVAWYLSAIVVFISLGGVIAAQTVRPIETASASTAASPPTAPQSPTARPAAPQRFTPVDRAPFEFEYPARWSAEPMYAGNPEIDGASIRSPEGCELIIQRLPSLPGGIQHDDGKILDTLRRVNIGRAPRIGAQTDEPIRHLGPFNGRGTITTVRLHGQPGLLVVFSHPLPNKGRLVFVTTRFDPDSTGAQRHIERILETLRVSDR